jgi:hypothetical protein
LAAGVAAVSLETAEVQGWEAAEVAAVDHWAMAGLDSMGLEVEAGAPFLMEQWRSPIPT